MRCKITTNNPKTHKYFYIACNDVRVHYLVIRVGSFSQNQVQNTSGEGVLVWQLHANPKENTVAFG